MVDSRWSGRHVARESKTWAYEVSPGGITAVTSGRDHGHTASSLALIQTAEPKRVPFISEAQTELEPPLLPRGIFKKSFWVSGRLRANQPVRNPLSSILKSSVDDIMDYPSVLKVLLNLWIHLCNLRDFSG